MQWHASWITVSRRSVSEARGHNRKERSPEGQHGKRQERTIRDDGYSLEVRLGLPGTRLLMPQKGQRAKQSCPTFQPICSILWQPSQLNWIIWNLLLGTRWGPPAPVEVGGKKRTWTRRHNEDGLVPKEGSGDVQVWFER